MPLKSIVGIIESGTSVNSDDRPTAEGEIGVLKTSCVYQGRFEPTEHKAVVADELNKVSCPVRKDAIIVSRMNTPDLIGAAGLASAALPNIFLPDRLWQIVLSGAHPPFINYWTKSVLYRDQLRMACTGTSSSMQNISQPQYLSFRLALPPLSEQQIIAVFLDQETAKIDALVAEQERLIALLKEKRQAVISHAVTKGLDSNAPMKNSGVEWLGQVPAHWEVVTVRRCAVSVQTGGTPHLHQPVVELAEGHTWYTPGDFGEALILDGSARRLPQAAIDDGDAKVFPPGSVLIVSIGATLGKVGFTSHAASANQQINAIIPGIDVDGYFLAYSLSTKSDMMRVLSNSSTIGIMNQEKTKEILVVLPPIHEQRRISTYLDSAMTGIEQLNAESARAIALLRERRAALISAAVTGKIDVRGFVRPEQEAA